MGVGNVGKYGLYVCFCEWVPYNENSGELVCSS